MVYFIQAKDGGPIKIGWSSRLTERIKQLHQTTGLLLRVLAVMDGNRDKEVKIHKRFNHLRLKPVRRCEWFKPADELTRFIARNGKPWDGSDERPIVPIIVLLGTLEQRDWIESIRRTSLKSKTFIVRHALAEWAERYGYPSPPEPWRGA